MKIRMISIFLSVLTVAAVLLTGCSSDKSEGEKNNNNDNVVAVPQPKPIENVTLVALQASVPEGSVITAHKLEFQLPEVLDTSYDQEEYNDYRIRYSLDDYKMADAAIEAKLDAIYKAETSDYWFLHEGEEVFQITDNSWGIIKTVRVKAFTETGVLDEEVKFVLMGVENSIKESNP